MMLLTTEMMLTSPHSSSPLLSTLADADPTAVARRWVVAGTLPHFESDATAAAALAPRRPGSPAAIPEEQHVNTVTSSSGIVLAFTAPLSSILLFSLVI